MLAQANAKPQNVLKLLQKTSWANTQYHSNAGSHPAFCIQAEV
jgi:hypothetical protein